MKKIRIYQLPIWLMFSVVSHAAPGEFWEMSTSMEGMGMAMPAHTSKECIPIKDDGNPAGIDKNCKITDVKHIPNGSSWKMSCNDGTTGSGKQTRIKDTISSDILMNTNDGSMKMSMVGKKVGGSCETEAKMKAIMAEAEKGCDLSNKKSYEVVMSAPNYTTNGALCAGKKEPFCSLIKRELPNDTKSYEMLDTHLKAMPDSNIVKACGLNVEAARKSLCKSNASNKSELQFLDAHCPSEAKIFHEKIRLEECSGRQFTSVSNKEKCLSGTGASGNAVDASHDTSMPVEQSASKSGNVATDAAEKGKKAIKGLKDAFGF